MRVSKATASKLGVKVPTTPKYRNVKSDGFDSKKEERRYAELQLLERAGQIRDLERQFKFPLVYNGVKICVYIADFVYREKGFVVIEDVKSPVTRKNRAYRIKVKLMKAFYGHEIRES